MATRTAETLISEGLLLAGDDALSTRGLVWLNDWLRSVYASWPWPVLKRRIAGVALAAGTTSLSIGKGSNGVTNGIHRIFAPMFIYDSVKSFRSPIYLRDIEGGNPSHDIDLLDTTINRAAPYEAKVRPNASTPDKWDIIPYPVPDKAYLLAIDYQDIPADLATSGTPLYPNDRTIMHAIKAEALRFKNGDDDPSFQAAAEEVGAMIAQDRMKYGHRPGMNDVWGMDTNVFR